MNVEQVRELLRARCNGNQAAWATDNGMSQAYVSDVITGRREPGSKVLHALGLRKEAIYRKETPA